MFFSLFQQSLRARIDKEQESFCLQGMIKMGSDEIKSEYLNGAYREIANLLGSEAALKIHSAYRGQQITFPVQLFSKEYLKKQIAKEYDGGNIKQLATKYGYSEKWIRRILKDYGCEKQPNE